jgi:hypothetical protein
MEKWKVRDLMIPVEKFPKISGSADIFQGLGALEKAQQEYLAGESEQRILLVQDEEGKILGKLSPIDLLRGLETNYTRVEAEKVLTRFGLRYLWDSMKEDHHLWEDPFRDLCGRAEKIQLQEFVQNPSGGQSVDVDDAMAKCLHLFVMNRHDALFVLAGSEIVGMLRFSDIYRKASQVMKECRLEAT